MAIGHMNYKQLTPEQRFEGSKKARERIRGALANPSLTPDQSKYLQAEMRKIDNWERCALDCADHDHDPPPS